MQKYLEQIETPYLRDLWKVISMEYERLCLILETVDEDEWSTSITRVEEIWNTLAYECIVRGICPECGEEQIAGYDGGQILAQCINCGWYMEIY